MSENKYKFTLDTTQMNDSHMGLSSRIKPQQRVLELGCSSGYLSKFLKEDLACHVVGVDIDPNAVREAEPFCNQVIVADLDNDLWLTEIENQQFDVVLCADVLEHLKDPVTLLCNLQPFLHADSLLLASVPNIAHASIRLELLQGHFDYESLGLLDNTHLHFYTRDGLIAMLMQAGYVCCDIAYSIQDMADEAIDQHLANAGLQASAAARHLLHAPDAIAYQFIIEARPAKTELVQNLPSPLTPKPLVSSNVFYSEKQEKIATLELQIKHLQESLSALELRCDAEREHNTNHQQNITQLENKINIIEQQLNTESTHNQNHLKTIQTWKETTSVLDNALFDLTEKLQEQNKLYQHIAHLEGQVAHFQNEAQHLAQVLQRVHNKVSYRMVRFIKDSPKRVSSLLTLSIQKPGQSIDNSTEPPAISASGNDYSAWLAEFGHLTEQKKSLITADISSWQSAPKIAVLMPVYNPNETCLVNAIESVLQQLYGNFELCIADDASTKSHVRRILESYSRKDSRIKVIFRNQNGHISAASNSALSLVEADYVALMDHDDLLAPNALYWIAKTVQDNPAVQLIYSDEDKMNLQGQRYAPYFKPDWNPELLLSHNFICHLGVYKTDRVKGLGGFDSNFDGAQDYDLVLRYIENLKPEQIVHIPRILYHWRAVIGSTANGVHEKPYAEVLIAKAVRAALDRRQRPAEVLVHSQLPGALRVRYLLPESLPLVSIVIPTRNGFNLLRRCVESIFAKTSYPNFELLIIDNGSDELAALRYLQRLHKDSRVTVIQDDSPFNYSALNNKAVAQANGDIIALLNNDLEVINDDWLTEMVSHAIHPEVGAVGAKLYYPDDTIQHAGVIVGLGGVAGHSHKHFPRDNPGICGRLLLTQNLSAVTAACLVLRKEVFDAVGGLDGNNLSVAFNDVDFCLRIQEMGYYNVWTPYAELYHYESATRGYEDTPEKQARFAQEVDYMKKRWGKGLLEDPAYNPNLTLDREDFSFAWPPRVP
jgi:glycosyltransferase involved in cell wall biosynthesis/2-polyprenyl-3-methyl-5-hydroxy-6-metoxy-1,4-benzoquinol methylase